MGKLRVGIVGSGYEGGRLAEAIGLNPSKKAPW